MKTYSNSYNLFFAFCLICNFRCDVTHGLEWPVGNNGAEEWQGRWFPHSPNSRLDNNPTVEYPEGISSNLIDKKHGVKMGIPNRQCDDGKVNITLDWDNSPINYTCFEDKSAYLPNLNVHPIWHSDHIPQEYNAQHKCMNTPIFYDDDVPTFGPHRPLWPKWGEYVFLPKQRWLHSLEHGGVVMLYHPCANKEEVFLLKNLVTGCLYRHIITPFNLLKPDRPLALVTWGNRFEMSKVDPQLVAEFIKNFALQGPEQKFDDGQFEFGLENHAKIVLDEWDHHLCPNL